MLFLIRFATEDSCGPLELHSILENNAFPYEIEKKSALSDPFEIINCTFEAIDVFCSRSIWTKSVSLLISYGKEQQLSLVHKFYGKKYNLPDLCAKKFLKANPMNLYDKKLGFKLNPQFYGDRLDEIDSKYVIEKFFFLIEDFAINFKGTVIDIDIVEYEKDTEGKTVFKLSYLSIFYKKTARGHSKTFGVKNLEFIGRTSMTIENTVFMTNLCDVRPGMIVYDPCVGSGSLLIGAALFGAYVLGSDMDFNEMVGNMVHKTKIRTKLLGFQIGDNFKRFNGKFLGAVQAEIGKSPIVYADRILMDMPYGVRISCNDVQAFLKKANRLALTILPTNGILGIWIHGADGFEMDGMIHVTRYVQTDLQFLRSLHVFRKI